MSHISTFLWFDTQAEEAARLYTSVVPRSRVTDVARWPAGGPAPAGSVMSVSFELDGQRFVALNGGPRFALNEAVSVFISCDSQDEVDRLWTALTADGGHESMCGWLKDRFGLSWQVIPRQLTELMRDPDPRKAGRVTQALMTMRKIDIAALERAHAGR